MDEKDLQDFCIRHNFPFTVEFKEPWYPKPIEITLRELNDTKQLTEILRKVIINDLTLKTEI